MLVSWLKNGLQEIDLPASKQTYTSINLTQQEYAIRMTAKAKTATTV